MRRGLTIGLAASMLLIPPAVAQAQASSGGVQDGIKLGQVFISGENPVIRLLDRPGGTAQVVASFWRIVWSPVGPGHVCYLTTGDGSSREHLRIALVDNRRLFDYLTNEILGAFDTSYRERPFEVIQATFGSTGDPRTEWKEACTSDRYKIELVWRDFYPPFQLDTPTGGARNPFGLTSLFVPARSAEVRINGVKAQGSAYPQMRGPVQSSSAFLAFSETWIK